MRVNVNVQPRFRNDTTSHGFEQICHVINLVGDTHVKHLLSCNTHIIGGGLSSNMNDDC